LRGAIAGIPPIAQVAAIAAGGKLGGAVAYVGVAIEIVVAVDGDVVASPTSSTAPTAAPERPHRDADAEGNSQACWVIPCRRIVDGRVRIDRRAVNNHRIVGGHVHHLRIGLFDNDDTLVFDDLGFYFLLLGGFQIAFILGLLAHPLNGLHDVALLCKERVA
jgi:hypothetical protein